MKDKAVGVVSVAVVAAIDTPEGCPGGLPASESAILFNEGEPFDAISELSWYGGKLTRALTHTEHFNSSECDKIIRCKGDRAN